MRKGEGKRSRSRRARSSRWALPCRLVAAPLQVSLILYISLAKRVKSLLLIKVTLATLLYAAAPISGGSG